MKVDTNTAKKNNYICVKNKKKYWKHIYDNLGRLIKEINHNGLGTDEEINIGAFVSGVYNVKIITPKTVYQQKFNKQ